MSDPDWIQTNDPKLRRFVLYSAELPGQDVLPAADAPGSHKRPKRGGGEAETAAKIKKNREGTKPN